MNASNYSQDGGMVLPCMLTQTIKDYHLATILTSFTMRALLTKIPCIYVGLLTSL